MTNTRRKLLSWFGLAPAALGASVVATSASPSHGRDIWIEQADGVVSVKGAANGKEFTIFRFDESCLAARELVAIEVRDVGGFVSNKDYTGVHVSFQGPAKLAVETDNFNS